MFQRIEIYKASCLQAYREMKEERGKAKQLIKQVNAAIEKQKAYLKQLHLDDSQTIAANQQINKLNKLVEKERKTAILNGQQMKFEMNKRICFWYSLLLFFLEKEQKKFF